MSVEYTITVPSKSAKDSILKAIKDQHERAVSGANTLSFRAEDSYEEWTRVNEHELTRLKDATLIATEIGYDFQWKIVGDEDLDE